MNFMASPTPTPPPVAPQGKPAEDDGGWADMLPATPPAPGFLLGWEGLLTSAQLEQLTGEAGALKLLHPLAAAVRFQRAERGDFVDRHPAVLAQDSDDLLVMPVGELGDARRGLVARLGIGAPGQRLRRREDVELHHALRPANVAVFSPSFDRSPMARARTQGSADAISRSRVSLATAR